MKQPQEKQKKYLSQQNTNNMELKQYPTKKSKIYFQRQTSTLLCGMHAINNFLGGPKFTSESMNEICQNLAEGKKNFNPHKHWIREGDYDVNVLMVALGREGFETKWHDQRKQYTSEDLKKIEGFLVNIQLRKGFFARFDWLCCSSGRHWVTIKKISPHLYELPQQKINKNQPLYAIIDSLEQNYKISSQSEIIKYLTQIERQQSAQVLYIFRQPSEEKKKSEESIQKIHQKGENT